MEWYNILNIIMASVGTIGGISGVIAIYQAKANKDTIDIKNNASVLEQHQSVLDEYKDYIHKVEQNVVNLQTEVNKLKEQDEINTIAVYSSHRCHLPEIMDDCPVWRTYCDARDRKAKKIKEDK